MGTGEMIRRSRVLAVLGMLACIFSACSTHEDVPFDPGPVGSLTVTITADTNGVEVAWERIANTRVSEYRVYRRDGTGAGEVMLAQLGAEADGFLDRDVWASRKYRYRVAAFSRSEAELARSAYDSVVIGPASLSQVPDTIELAADGGSGGYVQVLNANGVAHFAWAVTSEAPWLAFSALSGASPDSFALEATKNRIGRPRVAHVAVEADGVIGAPDTIVLSQQYLPMGWWPISTGLNAATLTLTVYNGQLVAGGRFTSAGGLNANRIALWNGSSWSTLGPGFNDEVWALADYNGQLVAGGAFTTSGGSPLNHIAAWTGSSWVPLGAGVNDRVNALAVYNGRLIAGGEFTTAGGSQAYFVAAWDGSAWAPMGQGMNGDVQSLTVYGNELVAGGIFSQAEGNPAGYIASWNGSSWHALDVGMDRNVLALVVYDDLLIAGGAFQEAGGTSASCLAAWNGSEWSALSPEYVDGGIFDLEVYEGYLVTSGRFGMIGGISARNIAAWDGTNWIELRSRMDSMAYAVTVYDNHLVVGGSFLTVSGSGAGTQGIGVFRELE